MCGTSARGERERSVYFAFLSGESGRDMEVRVDESDDGFEFLDPE